jgi:hypothetical protein
MMVLYERARNWWIGSDPGLLRLRSATRTTAALGCSLLIMYVVTRLTGQPLTVALLGVVITMVASRSVNEPDPRRQRITMALLPVPGALSITVASLLAPHKVASDAVFVVIVFAAVYIRRFGARGRALGMVAFMAYFFTLYLRASISERLVTRSRVSRCVTGGDGWHARFPLDAHGVHIAGDHAVVTDDEQKLNELVLVVAVGERRPGPI